MTSPHVSQHRLSIEGISLRYGDRHVVEDLSLELPDGEVTVIVGPNACGKSTLLRAMSRLLRPTEGRIVLDGADLHHLPTRKVAQVLGLLPQSPIAPEGIVVADLVARGRHPHQRAFTRWSRADEEAVVEALSVTGVADLAERSVDELSGGQRQRVWIAMALAQQTDLLLLDEPTTFLDVAHQVEVLDLLTDLNRSRGTTVVMVLHDLNLATRYADHLVAMREGTVVATGSPREVVTPELVRSVFGLESVVIADPVSGTPLVVPRGSTPRRDATYDHRYDPRHDHRHTCPRHDRRSTPMMLARLKVAAISRPSPSFVRLELAGPDLADFGVDGPLFDQRFKLVLPGPAGLPALSAESWWTDFSALPEETRGVIRTYTVADIVGSGATTRLVVDVVLHPGAHGPGSAWASAAEIGHDVLAVLPRRGTQGGGIEFEPGEAERLLLVGDETALPAIHQILRELPPREGRTGTVFLEVPCAEDICDLPAIDGVEVTWLLRGPRPVGEPMIEAVSAHLGLAEEAAAALSPAAGTADDLPWETPTYSALGEAAEAVAAPVDGRYAWIAGEAGMVTALRRHLVGELGMPRSQVAFMGYWRRGVAMRA